MDAQNAKIPNTSVMTVKNVCHHGHIVTDRLIVMMVAMKITAVRYKDNENHKRCK